MVQQQQCRNRSQRHVRIQTSKKTKEKKPAQRGRGIPELERIILEEEQQKEIAAAAPTPILFPLPLLASLPLSTPNSSPLTPISSVHWFGFHPFPMPPDPPYSQGGNSGRNWMDFVNFDGAEKGSQQKPSSMVNIPESPPFSSGIDLQMGLPSFQIYIREYLMRMRPEGDGIVNQKWGHPSSLNDPPDGSSSSSSSSSFQSKFPSSSASCHRREGPLSSSIVHSAANNLSFVKTIKENKSLDERICTLGCPVVLPPLLNPNQSNPHQFHPPIAAKSFLLKEAWNNHFSNGRCCHNHILSTTSFQMGPSSDPSFPTSEGRVEKAGSAIDLNLKL